MNKGRYLLLFDFETTGLPQDVWCNFEPYPTIKRYSDGNPIMLKKEKMDSNEKKQIYYETIPLSASNPDKWPYVVQLSYLMYDAVEHSIIKHFNEIIRLPENIQIDPMAEQVHHISLKKTQELNQQGKPHLLIEECLDEFMKYYEQADVIIAHNLKFDKNMLYAELTRNQEKYSEYKNYIQNLYISKKEYCTGLYGKGWCKMERIDKKGTVYYKMPKLKELHYHLFGYEPLDEQLHDAFTDVLVCFRCFYYMYYDKQDICSLKTTPISLIESCNQFIPDLYKIPIEKEKKEKQSRKRKQYDLEPVRRSLRLQKKREQAFHYNEGVNVSVNVY